MKVRLGFLYAALFGAAALSFSSSSSSLLHAQESADEERVLAEMDKSAAHFSSAQANLSADIYTSVVAQTETQTGKIYFRRVGAGTEMALDMSDPAKYVLVAGGKLQLFEPNLNRVTVYDISKHQDEYEALLELGFGGSGHALLKSFDVKYLGTEKIGAVDAGKLDLVPKSPGVRGKVPHIILWIDPKLGVAVQQQLFEPGGEDYRLSKYTDIQMNQKIPDTTFKLKTNGKTTTRTM